MIVLRGATSQSNRSRLDNLPIGPDPSPPAQMIEMRKELPADLASSVFVEADIDEGMLVVRSFVPDDSWAKTIATYLGSISCTTL